MSLEAS